MSHSTALHAQPRRRALRPARGAQLDLMEELRLALRRGQLRLAYQPIHRMRGAAPARGPRALPRAGRDGHGHQWSPCCEPSVPPWKWLDSDTWVSELSCMFSTTLPPLLEDTTTAWVPIT